MQSHAPPRRKSSAGVIITIMFLFGFFFIGGVILVGIGAFVFARAEAQQVHAVAAREMARSQAHLARAEAEMRRQAEIAEQNSETAEQHFDNVIGQSYGTAELQPAKRDKEPIRVANREITLLLDKQGKIKLDGKPIENSKLMTALRSAGKGRESALTVTVKADKNCLFDHVAKVLSICQELDIPNVKISAVD